MERSPYDPSAEEAFHRNQKRLKEELADFEANISVLEKHLKEAGMSWDEIRGEKGAEPEPEKMPEIKKRKLVTKKNWLRI